MKSPFITLIIVGIISFQCSTNLEEHSASAHDLTQAIDSILFDQIKNSHFNGSLVIQSYDSIIYHKDTGVANVELNMPIDPATRFDIASVNKSFIAALTLLAIDEGKFDLDSKLVDLLSNFTYKGYFNRSITVRQMLSHTSGLPDYGDIASISSELTENRFQKFKRTHFTNEEYVDFISRISPVEGPGEQFYYSNFAYHLLCVILEDTYQVHFKELLEHKISTPLGLNQTICAVDNKEQVTNLATGYILDSEQNNWIANAYIDLSLGRRIFSTTADLAKWANAVGKGGLLSNSLQQQMLTNQLETIDSTISYGFGWVIFEQEDHFKMGDLEIDTPYFIHGGNTDGYKAMLVNINQGQYVISMLCNTGTELNELEFIKTIAHTLIHY